ncbi:MAG: putative inner membrane protein [Hyphomonadaceae bacterium]|nr:MAG: putative inner membrane protein [Hyphomonadaceae bacterium]
MNRSVKHIFWLIFLAIFIGIASPSISQPARTANSQVARQAILRNYSRLEFMVRGQRRVLGSKTFLRVFTQGRKLEVWVANNASVYRLVRTYRLCSPSGKNARTNIPIGIYAIARTGLQTTSDNFLRLRTNYPNAFDAARGRGQNPLFIGATCVQGGGISLTDTDLEELYVLVYAALANRHNAVPLHIFPYELNAINSMQPRTKSNRQIIEQLTPIYRAFESNHRLPNVLVSRRGYRLEAPRAK